MRKKGGFLSGLQMKIEGWIGGAWSMALLVLIFSPCAMGMIVVIALAPGINRNSDSILKEGEVYLHWLFRLLSEYAMVLFIFLFFFVIVAYLAISNLSRAAGHVAVLVAKAYLPAPQNQLPAPQVTYNVAAPSQEIQALPAGESSTLERPALPAPAATPAQKIAKTIQGLGLKARVTELAVGPQVVTYGLTPQEKKKDRLTTVSELKGKADDIALALKAESLRFFLYDGYLALEVPRKKREYVSLFELFQTEEWRGTKALVPLALGKDTFGKWLIGDLSKLPHLLIGGTTGGGKSVALNVILCGLIEHFSSRELILKLVDPKRVEFTTYPDFAEVITEVEEFKPLLSDLIQEMEQRLGLFAEAKKRDIQSYNEYAKEPMPYIVVVIDEYGDIVLTEDVEKEMVKLAQKARATGIHFILATQRPDKDVVTGKIKANFPGILALKVTNKVNSGIILDENGAEALAGFGDALYKDQRGLIRRIQIGHASDKEIEAFLGSEAVRNRWELVPSQNSSFSEPARNQSGTSRGPAGNLQGTSRGPAGNQQGTRPKAASPQEEIENLRQSGESNFEIAKYIAEKYPKLSANSIQRMVGMGRPEAQRAVREVRGGKQAKQKVYVNGHSKEASYA